MHNRALGSTCSNLCQAMGPVSYGFVSVLSPKASWRLKKPRWFSLIFLVVVGNSGEKKNNPKKQCFFWGGGTKHDQMIQNASNSMQQPLSFVRPVVGMWKLGSLWRKGHRGNISLLSLARCRHSDPHDFVFPRFFPSDCGSALLFWGNLV